MRAPTEGLPRESPKRLAAPRLPDLKCPPSQKSRFSAEAQAQAGSSHPEAAHCSVQASSSCRGGLRAQDTPAAPSSSLVILGFAQRRKQNSAAPPHRLTGSETGSVPSRPRGLPSHGLSGPAAPHPGKCRGLAPCSQEPGHRKTKPLDVEGGLREQAPVTGRTEMALKGPGIGHWTSVHPQGCFDHLEEAERQMVHAQPPKQSPSHCSQSNRWALSLGPAWQAPCTWEGLGWREPPPSCLPHTHQTHPPPCSRCPALPTTGVCTLLVGTSCCSANLAILHQAWQTSGPLRACQMPPSPFLPVVPMTLCQSASLSPST